MNKELKETILNPIFKGNPITVLVHGSSAPPSL